VDQQDMNTLKIKSDALIPEPIGVSVSCTIQHIYDLSIRCEKEPLHDKCLLCSFITTTDEKRRGNCPINRASIQKTLNDKNFKNKNRGALYWSEMNNHKFVAAPEGNGVDCHRAYEALYWKSIPIVEDNPFMIEKFKNLPVLFTHDYSEINEPYLLRKYKEMLDKEYDFSFLFLSFFSVEIRSVIQRRSHYWSNKVNKFKWTADTRRLKNCNNMYTDISFITLTNNGYKQLTHNCLASIQNISDDIKFHIFCLDSEAVNDLKDSNNFKTELFTDKSRTTLGPLGPPIDFSKLSTFQDKNWKSVTIQKLFLIHQQLINNKFVLFTDGDIVFKNSMFLPYLYLKMLNNPKIDVLTQHEWGNKDTACSGFMMIRRNEKTLKFFEPENIKRNTFNSAQNDQAYINKYKKDITLELLSPHLFPNGNYFYKVKPKSPFLIHYNYLVGVTNKQNKMVATNSWLL
jgi:hypothetical protein